MALQMLKLTGLVKTCLTQHVSWTEKSFVLTLHPGRPRSLLVAAPAAYVGAMCLPVSSLHPRQLWHGREGFLWSVHFSYLIPRALRVFPSIHT